MKKLLLVLMLVILLSVSVVVYSDNSQAQIPVNSGNCTIEVPDTWETDPEGLLDRLFRSWKWLRYFFQPPEVGIP